MPIYEYECGSCGRRDERVVRISDRDEVSSCECGGAMVRDRVNKVRVGSPAYQMQAVMSDGSHVKGHFGKEAALRSKVKGKRQ